MSADLSAELMGTNAAARAGVGPAAAVVAPGVTTSAGDVLDDQIFYEGKVTIC